jgi:hypothetical protein
LGHGRHPNHGWTAEHIGDRGQLLSGLPRILFVAGGEGDRNLGGKQMYPSYEAHRSVSKRRSQASGRDGGTPLREAHQRKAGLRISPELMGLQIGVLGGASPLVAHCPGMVA